MQWYNWFRVLLLFSPFSNTNSVTWIVTFYQLIPVVKGVMHKADNACSIRSTWLLSAGPISHNSIQLLIVTEDFVALY